MKLRQVTLAIAVACIALSGVAAAAPTQPDKDTVGISAKRHHAKKHAARRASPIGTKIACPKGGCREVPANCTVTMETTRDDMPTGYELIQCP